MPIGQFAEKASDARRPARDEQAIAYKELARNPNNYLKFYGEFSGLQSYTSVMGAEITLPQNDTQIVELQSAGN